jgi:hypothetical protein
MKYTIEVTAEDIEASRDYMGTSDKCAVARAIGKFDVSGAMKPFTFLANWNGP